MKENIIYLVIVVLIIGAIAAGYYFTDSVTGNGVPLF
jgi:hypothetical protein